MPRPRSADPVVTKPVSLRASEWAAVEATGLGRSACVREALESTGVLREPTGARLGASVLEKHESHGAALRAGARRQAPKRPAADCRHPANRRLGDNCGACGVKVK